MESPLFKQQTYIAMSEIRISSRLAIRQNYNRINGQNNFSFGGQWMSNFISFSVDQQVYMSPLAAAFGGKSVFQAWTFSVRLRAPYGASVNADAYVDPYGTTRLGGYLSGLRYSAVAPTHSVSPVFSKYIIRGKVLDETGKGVWGIAVRIGTELVLSDENGEFYLNVKNTKPMPLTVVKESSIQTSRWSLNSSPTVAQGRLEAATDAPLQITVNTSPVRASM
jgi:hypothetical protein